MVKNRLYDSFGSMPVTIRIAGFRHPMVLPFIHTQKFCLLLNAIAIRPDELYRPGFHRFRALRGIPKDKHRLP